MLRRLIPSVTMLVLVATGLLLVVQEASARPRRGRNNDSGYNQSWQFDQNALYNQQGIQGQMLQGTGYQAYYRSPVEDVPRGAVLLNVQVPQDAQVWIDGQRTNSTGQFRQYVTPPLDQDRPYQMKVEARWTTPEGEQVRIIRPIQVRPDQNVNVDFLRPTQGELSRQSRPTNAQFLGGREEDR